MLCSLCNRPGTPCDQDSHCGGGNLKCIEQEGQLFGPFSGMFAMAQVCTVTCNGDSDCARGTCMEEDGLSGLLTGLLGHAKYVKLSVCIRAHVRVRAFVRACVRVCGFICFTHGLTN